MKTKDKLAAILKKYAKIAGVWLATNLVLILIFIFTTFICFIAVPIISFGVLTPYSTALWLVGWFLWAIVTFLNYAIVYYNYIFYDIRKDRALEEKVRGSSNMFARNILSVDELYSIFFD